MLHVGSLNCQLSRVVGQREAVLSHADQLPGSQQSDRGGLHAVHTGQSHPE